MGVMKSHTVPSESNTRISTTKEQRATKLPKYYAIIYIGGEQSGYYLTNLLQRAITNTVIS